LPNRIVKRVLPICWRTYVAPIIDDLAIDPKYVWIVGKGVHDLIRGKYATGRNWFYQPNAHSKHQSFYEEKRRRIFELQKAVRSALQN
jgi:hypothetical protein